jgi:hypothetical protein
MLTDDDLTSELRAAFQSATADLRYDGRTRPAHTRTVVLPVVVAASFAAAAAIGVAATGGHHRQAPLTVVGPAVHPSEATSTKLVTKTIKLAGFTVTYRSPAGDPPPVYAYVGFHHIPRGLREVHLTGTKAKAWVGKDPRNGRNAVYVKAPTRNGGNLFALESSQWTQHQLVHLLKHGSNVAVPAVSAHHSG